MPATEQRAPRAERRRTGRTQRAQPSVPARVLGVLLGSALAAHAATAVDLGRSSRRDLVDLALGWARGDYRSPLLCEFEGTPRRGLRRVLIAPAPRSATRRADRITFFDLNAPNASRCFSDLGREEPNLVGTLYVTLDASSNPDTALHDFKSTLRRENGFEYRIERGRIRLGAVGEPPGATREVDFRGGQATLTRIEPGSDEARLLAEFPTRRKLRLALEAPDATRLVLHLFEVAPR